MLTWVYNIVLYIPENHNLMTFMYKQNTITYSQGSKLLQKQIKIQSKPQVTFSERQAVCECFFY